MTGASDLGKVRLGANRYGKERVRLVRVTRRADRHDLTDLTVQVTLEGEFAAAYVDGDNGAVLPTDTMRGTVYAFAGEEPVGAIETFGARLARHFVQTVPSVSRAQVSLTAEPWARITTGGAPHPHAFLRAGGGRRTATVTATTGEDGGGVRTEVRAGLTGLTVLKTTGSAFEGFLRDPYTTLPETTDRILATVLDTGWRYATTDVLRGDVDWDAAADRVRQALLTAFAEHDDSQSLQHTLYVMGSAALAARPEIAEITLAAPNKHHLLVDLSPYGQANENTVFVATDAPYGLIEATVTRAH